MENGEVYRVAKKTGKNSIVTSRIKKGYLHVSVFGENIPVHRIVALTHVDNPDNKPILLQSISHSLHLITSPS